VGVKPTYGRCSRWGITAFCSSLDQAGSLSRTVYDSALLLEAIAGHDPKDSTSSSLTIPPFSHACGRSVKGFRVGIPKEWQNEGLDPEILAHWQQAQKVLEEAGCEMVSVSLPYSTYALPCYYMLVCAEAASNLERYDGVRYGLRVDADNLADMYEKTRGEGFGAEVKRRILIGTYVLSHGYYEAYYGKAQKVRQKIIQEFQQVFEDVHVLLTPTTPTPAFSLDQTHTDPLTMYLNDVLTVPVNIGKVCGLSLPFGLSSQGMPIGLQVIAPSFQEERLFQFGSVLEMAADFPAFNPSLPRGGALS
jgi:aspartyl-tRNA(Asn)/glutamyl-tRNA(Gln) amidotransferase subunit A